MGALNLLAFDFGASSTKALLGKLDRGRLQIHPVHQWPNGPVEVAGHLYWDVLQFVRQLKEGLARASGAAAGPLACIGIDTWGVDYALLDGAGQLMGNPYHYRDSRTADATDRAFAKLSKEAIWRKTGNAFHPYNTLYQLLATQIQSPGMLDRAETMLMMPDLLAYFLTGEKATEYTEATTSQLIDATGRSWCWEIIAAMEIPRRIFTAVREPGTIRGPVLAPIRRQLNLGPVNVAAVASHDTASAVVAVPAGGDDCAYLSCGTWSLLGVELKAPILSEKALQSNFTNEGGPEGTYRFLRNITGLWILQECKRQWDRGSGRSDFGELIELARQSAELCCFVDPDDDLFHSPSDMPEKIRRFCRDSGQTPPSTKGQVVRCVLESLALKCRWTVEELEKILARRIETLHIVGGAVRNTLLNEFIACALNRPVVSGPAEATAIGNLMMQARALGEVNGLAEIREIVARSFPVQCYNPRNAEQWDQAYQRFQELL